MTRSVVPAACLVLLLVPACNADTSMPGADVGVLDSGADGAAHDGGHDAGADAGARTDGAAGDAGLDATTIVDAGADAAAQDAGSDVGTDVGTDAFDPCSGVTCAPLDGCHVAGTCTAGTCSNPNATDGTHCSFAPGGPGLCTAGSCTATCTDNLQDGTETAIDCGGGVCPTCAVGSHCVADSDCASNACDAVSSVCVSSQCADHRQDGSEVDVDCGGGCPACAIGQHCASNADCTSNACDSISLSCVANQCADHREDGTETDTDCGGSCPACTNGQMCATDGDCTSMACDAISLRCVPSQCGDNRRDGMESDVDCGGGTCGTCGIGRMCQSDGDCQSNACDATTLQCVASQCADHRQDGVETDVDCGGGTCARCAINQRCMIDGDCTSMACDAGSFTCVSSQCIDHRLDGAETDTDCGGPMCSRCGVGKRCLMPSDCASMACDAISLLCVSSTCADHRRDGTETDVDCGGSCAARCAIGLQCSVDTDCQSNACDATTSVCVASQCSDHRRDGAETDLDCGGGTCPGCANGLGCNLDSDCVSNACDANTLRCVASQCIDHRQDGVETDIDCGGANACARCLVGQRCIVTSDCTVGHTCAAGVPHVCL